MYCCAAVHRSRQSLQLSSTELLPAGFGVRIVEEVGPPSQSLPLTQRKVREMIFFGVFDEERAHLDGAHDNGECGISSACDCMCQIPRSH